MKWLLAKSTKETRGTNYDRALITKQTNKNHENKMHLTTKKRTEPNLLRVVFSFSSDSRIVEKAIEEDGGEHAIGIDCQALGNK